MKKVWIEDTPDGRILVVDGEAFDWGIEPASIEAARVLIQDDPLQKNSVMGSVIRHLVVSMSDLVGFPVSLKDINDAIERGYFQNKEELNV